MQLEHMTRIRRWPMACLALALVAGCSGNPSSSLPPLEGQAIPAYTLRSGDLLRIVVFGQDTLPTEYTIDDQGSISLPLVGLVPAANMTPQELEVRLTEEFTRVLVDPSISVQVISPRPVYVLGGVNEPGAYPYVKDMTVMSAAAMANGFTPYAYEDYVQVTRTGPDGQQHDFRATAKDYVQPDDIIYIYEEFEEY